jgi:hypothetical protein
MRHTDDRHRPGPYRLPLLGAAVILALVALIVAIVGYTHTRLGSKSSVEQPTIPRLELQTVQVHQPATRPQRAMQLPDEIRRALARNAEQVGPITVAWSYRSQSPLSVEQAMEILKTSDYLADCNAHGSYDLRLSWQDGKYRALHRADDWPSKLYPGRDELEYTFDGQVMCLGATYNRPNEPASRTLSKVTVKVLEADEKHSSDSQFVGAEFFDSAGLRMPVRLGDLKERAPVRFEILHMIDHGARLVGIDTSELEGRKLVRLEILAEDPDRRAAEKVDTDTLYEFLRTNTFDGEEYDRACIEGIKLKRTLPEQRIYVFYLDPQFDYAIRRSEQRYDGGILLSRVDRDDFQKLPERDLYLPRRIVRHRFTDTNVATTYFKDPVVTGTIEVTSIDVEPLPEDHFILDYREPGTQIYERLEPGSHKMFEVDDDGNLREWARQRTSEPPTTQKK